MDVMSLCILCQTRLNAHAGVGSMGKYMEDRAVIDTIFHVDILEVNYATCRYIIDNIQTHFPF